jgi:hypothetical protein
VARRALRIDGAALVAGAAATVVFAVAFHGYQIQNRASDISIHIIYAQRIRELANVTAPHFLFQILLNVTHDLSRLSYEAAATLLLGLCYGGMAILIAHEVGHRAPHVPPAWRVAATVGVLVASHVFVQSIWPPNFYYGYVVPISYHNPTQQLSKLLSLAILFLYGRWVLGDGPIRVRRAIVLLGAGCIVSAVAKPTFLIAFVPAAGLVALRHVRARDWSRVVVFLAGVVVPSTAILATQLYWTYVAGPGARGDRIIFAPFAAAIRDPATMLARLPGSLLFPGVVLALSLRLRATTAQWWFAWLLLLIGLAECFLLAEAGPRLKAGNFFWTGQTVMFLLYVESMLLLVAQPPSRVRVGWAVFLLHVICGAILFGAVTLCAAERYL